MFGDSGTIKTSELADSAFETLETKKRVLVEAFGKTLKAHGHRQLMVKYWTQDFILRVEKLL